MTDDLDLRALHGRHEPDPAFRAALRQSVEEVVAGRPARVGGTDLDEGEDLIMLTDTRTEPQEATPSRGRRWFIAVAAAAAVVAIAAAVVARSGDGDEDGATITADADVLLEDTFDDDGGNWRSDPDVSIEDGQQVWAISVAGQLVHLRPLAADDPIVDMEVTAEVAAADPASTIGVHCRKGPSNNDYYHYLRVGPAGAIIGVLPAEGSTPAQVLATDPDVVRPTGPFTMAARCVDVGGVTQLTLLLDGDPVLDATYDAPLPPGFGGLEVQAGPRGSAPSEVRWERFTFAAIG